VAAASAATFGGEAARSVLDVLLTGLSRRLCYFHPGGYLAYPFLIDTKRCRLRQY